MGKTTNVLNKIQESRQYGQEQKVSDLFYIKDIPRTYSKKAMMLIASSIAVGVIAAVFIGTEIYNLEKSVKKQEKRINDLAGFLSNTKTLSDNQIQDFNFRLKSEAEDRKIQINQLALVDNLYYINLIKSIHANTFQIDHLDKYTENLNSKIEKISASDSQAKDLSYSPSGN